MQSLFSPTVFTTLLSILFAGVAALHLIGFEVLRQTYAKWGYPAGFREVTGTLLLFAAVCLFFPPLRLAGLILAALVMFLAATTLLHRGQWGFAAPIIALLFALIPVSLGAAV